MAAEIDTVRAAWSGVRADPVRSALGSTPEPADGPLTIAERIARDPPPPGVRRFYNTAFRMPERHGR